MLTKIGLLLFVAFMVWRMLAKWLPGRPPPRKPLPGKVNLVRCSKCGMHLLPGATCGCRAGGTGNDGEDGGQA